MDFTLTFQTTTKCSAHMAFYGVFWTELKLVSFTNAQKVSKQKFLSKHLRFGYDVSKWTRYISVKIW